MANEKRIVKIDLEDNIILESDGLKLRFEIEIKGVKIIMRPPSYREHMRLLVEYARLVQLLAAINPHLIFDLKKEGSNYALLWDNDIAQMFNSRKVTNRLENIIYKLIDGGFFKKWRLFRHFKRHADSIDFQKVFAFLVAIDDCIKKNAKSEVERVLGILPSGKPNFLVISEKNGAGLKSSSILNPTSRQSVFSTKIMNTTLN